MEKQPYSEYSHPKAESFYKKRGVAYGFKSSPLTGAAAVSLIIINLKLPPLACTKPCIQTLL